MREMEVIKRNSKDFVLFCPSALACLVVNHANYTAVDNRHEEMGEFYPFLASFNNGISLVFNNRLLDPYLILPTKQEIGNKIKSLS